MISTVVLASGEGARYGTRKQFLTLAGTRLVDRAVATASSVADAVVLVLPAGVHWGGAPVAAVVSGGPTRADSVRSGLRALPSGTDLVVIHDAAHPLASRALFEAVIARVQAGAYAAVPVLPIVETLARRGDDCLLDTTPAGDAVLVQMPQAFRFHVLAEAYGRGMRARDEASLLVKSGTVVHVVPGDPGNIHITTAVDLEVASRLA